MIEPEAVASLAHLAGMLTYHVHVLGHFNLLAQTTGDPAREHFAAISQDLRSAHGTIEHLRAKHVEPSDHARPVATEGRTPHP